MEISIMFQRTLSIVICSIFFHLLAVTAWAANLPGHHSSPCHDAYPLALDSVERAYAHDARGDAFRVVVPAAGLLALDVGASGTAAAEPWIGGFAPCDADLPTDIETVERSPDRLLLRVPRAGTYAFRVAAQDPSVALGRHRVAVRFSSASKTLARDNDEWEDDIDLVPGHPWPTRPELCATRDDDHDDVTDCATPLSLKHGGVAVAGEISGPWGDDLDLFTFVAHQQTTVHIEARSSSDLSVALHDHHGYRLTAGDSDERLRKNLTWTLVPGRYFVKVEGFGVEGNYRLYLEPIDR